MKEVPITQGKVALVDDEDYERVVAHRWYAVKREHTYYVCRKFYKADGTRSTQALHIFILNGATGIDHIDGNGLNNQKANLRICTSQENRRNTHKRKKMTSKYKGVSWNGADRVWRVFIYDNYKQVYLGRFNDEVEAAKAYDAKAQELFGEFANLNFPEHV